MYLLGCLTSAPRLKNRIFSGVPRMVFFVLVSYDLGQFRWISATTDFGGSKLEKSYMLKDLRRLAMYLSKRSALSYAPFENIGP